MVNFSLVLAALAAPLVLAHPGEHHSQEFMLKERQELQMHARHIQRGLDACAQHPKYLALKARGQARRAEMAKAIRRRRSLTAPMKRDSTQLATYAAKSHNSSTSGYTVDTDATTLFGSNKNASCVLTPKVTEGPYYVTGEYYRSDVTDGEPGVPLHLEYQYIDISTCDAAEGLYIEHWHANSTGVYSGIEANGNGVGTADPSNLNKTFLRGVQKTDSSGVVAFDTVFPGHYTGRTSHIHMMAHQNGTILSNNTFTSASVSQVGQVFFDQDLITDVSATEPYSSNTQTLTKNTDDSIAAGEADADFDPFAEYAYLGDSISDGLLAWIHIGIDMSASYSVSAGGHFYATGGVPGDGIGGGAGGPGGSMSGGAPSGAMPTGAPPTGAGGMSGAPPTASGSAGAAPSGSVSGSAPAGSVPAGSGSSAAQPSSSGTSTVSSGAQSGSNTSTASPSVSSSGASRGRGGKSGKSKISASHKSGTHKGSSHKHTGTAKVNKGAQQTGKGHSESCKDAKPTAK